MPSAGIARRRGMKHAPVLPRSHSTPDRNSYQTPPASRSSEPPHRRHDGENESHSYFSGEQLRTRLYAGFDDTFDRIEMQEEGLAHPGRRYRSRDDYGVCYSFYETSETFSPPRTPDGERNSLDWDSTFAPFTSSSFRRGSLVLDPAAFDSTPCLSTAPPSPGSNTALRLKRSAEALREFGKKVLPRLRLRTRAQDLPSDSSRASSEKQVSPKSHRPSGSTSSNSRSSAGRTRSNTVESNVSAISNRSRMPHAALASPFQPSDGDGRPFREFLEDSSDLLSPLATYRSMNGAGAPIVPTIADNSNVLLTPLPKHFSTPPVASPALASSALTPLVEQDHFAPKIEDHPAKLEGPYTGTDEKLEEIMRQMQEEDLAFADTEKSMRSSGWSSEQDISELRRRREEQQNLWQRRLDDTLDQVKAETNIDG